MLKEVLGEERTNSIRSILPSIPEEGLLRLVRSLARTETGFDSDLRTPFCGAMDREDIADRLDGVLGPEPLEDLEEMNKHERGKLGPLSIMLPYAERRADVMKYGHQEFSAYEDALDQAADNVRDLIRTSSLRPAEFKTALDLMPKDTSLGLPWVTRDKELIGHYFERATQLRDPEDIYPAILYWRGQAAGPNKTKQRVVWGFDHAETIFGATILYPVLNALSRLRGFSAWLGDVYVDQAVTDLINIANGRLIVSMDYSGFDSSLPRPLLDRVDGVLESWFTPPGQERIRLLAAVANSVPIVVPWELALTGRDGAMPSGSVLTNLRDTIANLIAGEYVGIRCNSPLRRFEVLGDDSVFVFQDDISPEVISKVVAELGLSSNPDKQFISREAVHYLQRLHTKRYVKDGLYRGVRSPFRALSGITGYERFRSGWNKYMDSARWIMQVENLKNHPKFSVCVKFLKDGDELLKSGMDPSTIFKKAGGSDVIRSTLSIASFPFNVQNPDHVNIFETTRVLRSL